MINNQMMFMKITDVLTNLNKNVCKITLVYCLQVNVNSSHQINQSI